MLETINTIAQIVAAAGVIAGLIFVGIQIRQNTRAVRAQTFHAITDSFNAINMGLGSSPQIASLVRRGFGAMANISEDEAMQFNFIALSVMRVMETLYFEAKLGVVGRELWEAEHRTLQALMAIPGMQQWWSTNPLSITQEFRELVNAAVRAAPPQVSAPPAPANQLSS